MHSFSFLTFSHPAQQNDGLHIIFKAILVIFTLVSMASLSNVLEETGNNKSCQLHTCSVTCFLIPRMCITHGYHTIHWICCDML